MVQMAHLALSGSDAALFSVNSNTGQNYLHLEQTANSDKNLTSNIHISEW